MIYRISGKIIAKNGGRIAIDTGGIAYELFVPLSAYAELPDIGADTALFTHFAVKEDSMSLYGFRTLEEKALFLQLLSVSKIGPKMALAILGNINGNELAATIVAQDVTRLSKVPGIGRKTAERIILELKDKIGEHEPLTFHAPNDARQDVISALTNLGYKPADCQKAMAGTGEGDFQSLLKKALAILSK